ncbi:hypothetical protein HDV00_008089 [Rhizophlyctis rosea]|nr:hypothetical protein HDV00_008089 [Rhizophlyctis rosea]
MSPPHVALNVDNLPAPSTEQESKVLKWKPSQDMKSTFAWSKQTVSMETPVPALPASDADINKPLTPLPFIAGIAHISNVNNAEPSCQLTMIERKGSCRRINVKFNAESGKLVTESVSPGVDVVIPDVHMVVIQRNTSGHHTVKLNDTKKEIGRVGENGLSIRSVGLTILVLVNFLLGIATFVTSIVLRSILADESGIDPVGAISTAATVTLSALALVSLWAGPNWSFQEVVKGVRYTTSLGDVICNGNRAYAGRLAMYAERLAGPMNVLSRQNTGWFRHPGTGFMRIEIPMDAIHLQAARCAIVAVQDIKSGMTMWPVLLDLRGQSAQVLELRNVANVWYAGQVLPVRDWGEVNIYDGWLGSFLGSAVA